LSYPAHIQ